jgi:hypothetical protein
MAITQLHQQTPNTKEDFSCTRKCKNTIKYDLIDIPSKGFNGVKSPTTLKGLNTNY